MNKLNGWMDISGSTYGFFNAWMNECIFALTNMHG